MHLLSLHPSRRSPSPDTMVPSVGLWERLSVGEREISLGGGNGG